MSSLFRQLSTPYIYISILKKYSKIKMSLLYKQRWEIVFLHLHPKGPQMSVQEVANYLKVSRGCVYTWISRYQETGTVDDVAKTGRTRATNNKQDLSMLKLLDKKPALTSTEVTNCMAKRGIQVSSRTVRRRLAEQGLKYGPVTKKPLLTETHIQKRLEWATNNVNRDWSKVIFTDEATFRLNDSIKRVWKKRGQVKVIRTVKHSYKVHVYGCFSARGFGKLVVFTDNLTGARMTELYNNGLLPSAVQMYGKNKSNWILQEDNDPKHKSRIANAFKEENGIQVMEWPAQSPDCNPIENVWGLLKARMCKKNLRSVPVFIKHIKDEWKQLSRDYAQKLVESCPKRCEAVIANNGDWTIY